MSRLHEHLRRLTDPLRSETPFAGAAATLLTGSIGAQALVYLARPALTRIYPPEVFGLLTVFVALSALIGTVSTGRYVDALLLPEEDSDAVSVGVLATLLCVGVSLGTVPVGLAGDPIARWFGEPRLGPWLLLLPAAVLGTGLHQIGETWYTRIEDYGLISRFRLVRSGLTVGIQLVGGLLGGAAGTLLGGYVGGYVGAGAGLLLVLGWGARDAIARACSLRALLESARRYGRFLRYSTPAALLNNLGGRLPVLILLFFFDAEAVAFYGLAHGSIAVPLNLINGATGQVFFGRAPEAIRENRLSSLTREVAVRLVSVALPAALLALWIGPLLFETVFGGAWRTAGVFARYLAPWLVLAAIASPLTRLFDLLEAQRLDFRFSAGMFVVHTSALLGACAWMGPVGALAVYGGVGLVLRLLHLGVLLDLAEVRARGIVRHLGRPVLGVLGWTALTHLGFTAGSSLGGLTALLLGGLGYAWLILDQERRVLES